MLLLQAYSARKRLEPGARNQRVPSSGGMYPVGSPEVRPALRRHLREQPIQRDKPGAILLGKLAYRGDFRVQVLAPASLLWEDGQQERLAENDANALGGRRVQYSSIGSCKGSHWRRIAAVVAPPGIVDADQNRHPMRAQRQAIFIPTRMEITNPVSTDAPIEELRRALRIAGGKTGGSHHRVAVPQIALVAAAASTIRDAVALKHHPQWRRLLHQI